MKRFILFAAATILLTSCSLNATERRISILEQGPRSFDSFEAPQEVKADVAFDVTILSYGGLCIEKDGAEISYEDMSVTLTPYDLHPVDPNATCPAVAETLSRTVSVTLSDVGEYTLSLRGRAVENLDDPSEELVTLQQTVQVND